MNPNDQNQSSAVILLVKVPSKITSAEKAKNVLLQDVQGGWTESGNDAMQLYCVDGQEHVFYIFERWKDMEALQFHFQQPYAQGAFELQTADLSEPAELNYLMEHWPAAYPHAKPAATPPLTTVITVFVVLPGSEAAFVGLFEEFVPHVRTQSGNAGYDFYSVIDKPQSFVLHQRWENQSFLDAHNRAQHTSDFLKSLSPLLQMPLSDCILHVTDISSPAPARSAG